MEGSHVGPQSDLPRGYRRIVCLRLPLGSLSPEMKSCTLGIGQKGNRVVMNINPQSAIQKRPRAIWNAGQLKEREPVLKICDFGFRISDVHPKCRSKIQNWISS